MSTGLCIVLDQQQDPAVWQASQSAGFTTQLHTTVSDALKSAAATRPSVVVVKLGRGGKDDSGLELIKRLRKDNQQAFCVVYSRTAAASPATRVACFNDGANMVTADPGSLTTALAQAATTLKSRVASGGFACHCCRMDGLTEDGLWLHLPLYHANAEPPEGTGKLTCQICKAAISRSLPLAVHIHDDHGPIGRGELPSGARKQMGLAAFALVVVRRESDGRYLLVQEFANQGYWLPGGGVDPGEDLPISAARECMEEAGVDIEITGLLRMEYSPVPSRGYARLRAIFFGRPKDPNQPAKSLPDFESVGACWVHPSELQGLPLRGDEPVEWISYLENGGRIHPIETLSRESDPVVLVK